MKKILDKIEFDVFRTRHIVILLLIISLITFHKSLESLFNKILIDPILNKIQYSLLHDTIFYILFLLVTFTFANRILRNYSVSKRKIVFLLFIAACYLFYRNISTEWKLVKLTHGYFYYLDLILVYIVFETELLLINTFGKDSKNSNQLAIENGLSPRSLTEAEIPFIIDNPLSLNDKDKLNRLKDAVIITNRLANTKSEKAIAIGIVGGWGIGKSSFFRLMQSELIKDNQNIIIEFNPWRGYKNDALSQDFFEALSIEVSKHSDLLGSTILRYNKTLLNIDNNYLKSAITLSSDIFDLSSVENLHNDINNALKKIDKNIFVFIDDLDRLSNDEVADIIKLVRNTADFYNLKFVLSYDKGYLLNALKAKNSYGYDNYLEKVILHEHTLKTLTTEQINDELRLYLEKYCIDTSPKLKNLFTDRTFQRHSLASLFLLNLRDVKRYANAFIPNYNKLFRDVDLIDYSNFELLRMKYATFALKLHYKKNSFFEETEPGILGLKNSDSKSGKTVIEEYIEDKENNLSIDYANKDNLILLLKTMFGDGKSFRSITPKSIKNDKNFSAYFRSELDKNQISFNEFDDILNLGLTIARERFKHLIDQEKGIAVLDKFFSYDLISYDTVQEFENFIRAMFIFTNLKDKNGNFINYLEEDIYKKFSNSNSFIKKFYNNNEADYVSFWNGIFEVASYPYAAESEFLGYLSNVGLSEHFIIGRKKVETHALHYFKSYCEKSDNLDRNFWMHFANCRLKEMEPNRPVNKRIPGAVDVYKTFILKSSAILKSHLEQIITWDNEGNYNITSIIPDVYDSIDTFIKMLKESKYASEPFVKEFVNFSFEYGITDQPIQFTFKELRVESKEK